MIFILILLGLYQVMSVLCDSLKNRCVNFVSRSFFGPSSPNSVYFVLSGIQVASLFDMEPMNDISIIYGVLSIDQQNKMTGNIRLDALCDYHSLLAILELIYEQEDLYLNNLVNQMQFDVGQLNEKKDWIELNVA